MELFDRSILDNLFDDSKSYPPIVPEKYEVQYSVEQLFETGIKVSYKFVIRNNKMLIYESNKQIVKTDV